MDRLYQKCYQSRLLATCNITITNKQNHNVIDYDYIESNRDYNRNYIRRETSSVRKQNPFECFDVSILKDNIRYMNGCIERHYESSRQGFPACGPRKHLWWPRPCIIEIEYVLQWLSKTGALVSMKTKSRGRLNMEDDLICAVHYRVLSLEYLCFLTANRLSLRIDCSARFATKCCF